MNVLLVLDRVKMNDARILVSLTEKKLKEQVIKLMETNRGKEAFEILKSRAEVKAYLPRGSKPSVKLDMTLFEDML